MDFLEAPGRPNPKTGYKCKICGKPGGKPDSHWYQLCPMRNTADPDQRSFSPPRKGYMCKFCHQPGGEPGAHWFQQCPRRAEFEGVQVPHPLKVVRSSQQTAQQMLQLMHPQQQQQLLAMNLNLGVMHHHREQTIPMFMYPSQQQQQQPSQMFYLQQDNLSFPTPQSMPLYANKSANEQFFYGANLHDSFSSDQQHHLQHPQQMGYSMSSGYNNNAHVAYNQMSKQKDKSDGDEDASNLLQKLNLNDESNNNGNGN